MANKTVRTRTRARNSKLNADPSNNTVMQVRNGNVHAATVAFDTVFAPLGGTAYINYVSPSDGFRFPRLAYSALTYAKYRWRKFVIRFVSTAATTASGNVIISAFYDRDDALSWQNGYSGDIPAAARQLASNAESCSGPLYGSSHNSGIHLICDTRRIHQRVPWFLAGPVGFSSSSAVFNQNSPMHIAVAVTGNSVTGEVGKIWIDYEIEFDSPVVPAPLASVEFLNNYLQSFSPSQPPSDTVPVGQLVDKLTNWLAAGLRLETQTDDDSCQNGQIAVEAGSD